MPDSHPTGRLDRLTVADIEAVQFTNVGLFRRHGYDETEVDDLLDAVAETLADDTRRIAEAVHVCVDALLADSATSGDDVARKVLAILRPASTSAPLEPLPADARR